MHPDNVNGHVSQQYASQCEAYLLQHYHDAKARWRTRHGIDPLAWGRAAALNNRRAQ